MPTFIYVVACAGRLTSQRCTTHKVVQITATSARPKVLLKAIQKAARVEGFLVHNPGPDQRTFCSTECRSVWEGEGRPLGGLKAATAAAIKRQEER